VRNVCAWWKFYGRTLGLPVYDSIYFPIHYDETRYLLQETRKSLAYIYILSGAPVIELAYKTIWMASSSVYSKAASQQVHSLATLDIFQREVFESIKEQEQLHPDNTVLAEFNNDVIDAFQ
jgi:hypothetical protein